MTAQLRGVNLGGWLVIEEWMTPTLFKGTGAHDEYDFMKTSGAAEKLEQHRATFIDESDFAWMADNGINAVRIPVGYWIFEGDAPYVAGIDYLDWAMEMADKYNIKALICLHGALGSQNGHHHSGHGGRSLWYRRREYQEQTIATLEKLAQRYYDSPGLWGIELLNEPKFGIIHWKLRRFYKNAYRRLVAMARPGVTIVFSDAFTPRLMSGAIRAKPSHPVVMDVHWYQFASIFVKWQTLARYFRILHRRPKLISSLQKKQPIIVGEWSLVLSGRIISELTKDEEKAAIREHARLQLEAYEETLGFFYWTYKTEKRGIWHLRSYIEEGILNFHTPDQSDTLKE